MLNQGCKSKSSKKNLFKNALSVKYSLLDHAFSITSTWAQRRLHPCSRWWGGGGAAAAAVGGSGWWAETRAVRGPAPLTAHGTTAFKI